jgi:hypothetical protein
MPDLFDADGRTSAARLLQTHAFFRAHPHGRVRTGVWNDPTWDYTVFLAWFRTCLHRKINCTDRRTWRCLAPQWQVDMAHDARLINDAARGIRQSSCNLLRTPRLVQPAKCGGATPYQHPSAAGLA